MASEANSCYCRPTRQGVFRRTDLHILIEEPLNTISIDYCYAAVFEEQGLFLYFWSGVGYGPCGAGGEERVESSGFRFRRETEKG